MSNPLSRPQENEYAPFYAGYVARVTTDDLFTLYNTQIVTMHALLDDLTPTQADFRPAPSEWSIKEVVGHINDAERIMAYRALRISRGDQQPLPGFDQDDYVREADFKDRDLADLLEEFEFLRYANILAFYRITPDVSVRTGTASGATVSVRALLYIIAGHVEHHLASLRADYLPKLVGA